MFPSRCSVQSYLDRKHHHYDLLALLLLYGALLIQPDHVVVHGGALEAPEDELLGEVARVVQLSEGASRIIPVPIWAPLSARVT